MDLAWDRNAEVLVSTTDEDLFRQRLEEAPKRPHCSSYIEDGRS